MVSVSNRRLAEWSLLTLVLVVLLAVFGRQVRSVQIQAERAAVQGTLGALRTALVLSHVTAQLAGNMDGNTAVAQISNPFLLLKARPGNFAGDFAMAQVDAVPLGAWAFDGDCGCVGYRLLYPEALDAPDGAESVWFRLEGLGAVLQLVPLTRYVWQGQTLN